MTKTAFAKTIGVNKSRLSNYLSGLREPDHSIINSIIKTYNINPAYFYFDNAPMFLENPPEHTIVSDNNNYENTLFSFNLSSMNKKEIEEFEKYLNKYAKFLIDDITNKKD